MEKLSPSLTVKRLLPEFISSNYPQFTLFLEKYYQFLEQNDQALGRLRSIETLNDVDEQTDDEILDMLMGPVLKDFPNTIKIDRKFLYKHAAEFFKSKGSMESVEALFRILYNEEIRVYLPKEDIIKVSSGNWVKRIAVQIANVRYSNGDSADALNMIGKEIVQYDAGTGGIVARGVVEDIDFVGERVTLYLAAEKQLREFSGDVPVVAIDSQDPEVEAKVECTVEKGKIASLTVREGGRDYTRTPDVVFYGGRYNVGVNAKASPIITNGVLTGFNILSVGEGYVRAPQVRVVNQIFADVQKNLGATTITNGGEYYVEGTEIPVLTSNGTGERFRISAVNGGSIQQIDVLNQGTDYSEQDEIVFDNVPMGNYNLFIAPETYEYSVWDKIGLKTELSATAFTYTSVDSTGAPLTIKSPRSATRITPIGSAGIHELYQVIPTRADETYTSSFYVRPEYSVSAVAVSAGGTGYTTAPTVEFIGGSPEIPAEATAVVSGGVVTGVTVTNAGRGYVSAPIVRINGDVGTGALATASINTEIDQLELIIGVETPAKAVPVISGGKVYALNLINGGANYTAAPAVTFYGGDGTGATAIAEVTDGVVTGFDFDSGTDGGSGYATQSPTLYFSKINYGRVVFDLKAMTVLSVNTYGGATGFSGNITPEADGVMRVSISGRIPGLALNDSVHASIIPRKSTATDPRVFALTDETKGLLVFGGLFDQSPVVRPYINVPSVSTAIAEIGEIGIEEILLEDDSKIAIGDDAFVMEANNGVVLAARVIDSGHAYQYKPNISITSLTTSGVGATAEAVMGRAQGLSAIYVSSVGSGYIGTGIPTDTYRRWQAGMVVYRNQILRYGNNLYIVGGKDTATTTVSPPTHTTSAPVLFDTSATYTYYGKAATITISAPDQEGAQYVQSLALASGGSGYTKPPAVTFSSPTTTGQYPDAYTIITGGSVSAIVLKDGGSGYDGQAIVTIAPPDGPGRQAQAIATMFPNTVPQAQATAEPIIDDGGFITGVTVTNAGAGYVTAPTVTITPPQISTGSPPGLVADYYGSELIAVKITNGGDGYKDAPVITVDAPSSQVLWLELVSGGSGFTSTPTLTITDGLTGSGAVATCTISGGAINAVTLLSRGFGYTTAPTVTITGGGGSGAVITAHIAAEILEDPRQAVVAVGASFDAISVSTTTNKFTINPTYAAMLRNNDHLMIRSTGTLPAPLQTDTNYHVGFLDSNSFVFMDDDNGVPIDLTTAGSGTITFSGRLVADEILQVPTDTKNVLYESDDLIISEVNTDRYHLTIPEQNYTYIEPATSYPVQSVTFGDRIAVTVPTATVINPVSFAYVTNPETIVLGDPYETYLKVFASEEFVDSLSANQCVVYSDTSGLNIPGLVSGQRYFVQDIDTTNNGFTLSKEISGTRIGFPARERSLSVISFNTVIDALFFATGETSQLSVGDVVLLYGEPGATVPTPLVDRSFYVVQQVSGSGYIKIANINTPTTPINITTTGAGSWRVLKTTAMSAHTFSVRADLWTMDTDDLADFAENDVIYYESSGLPAGNLLNENTYYVHNINYDTGTFALTSQYNGTTIDVIDGGSGSHTMSKVVPESDRIEFTEAAYNRLSAGVEVQYAPVGGVTATATSTIDSVSGAITDVNVVLQGTNYAGVPSVTIVDSDNTRPLGGIVVLTGGSGYTSAPTVNIEGGGGSGATATAVIDSGTGRVTAINIVNAGDGYSVAPNVTLTGGGASTQATAAGYVKPRGLGATAHAVMGTGGNADKVVDVVVDTAGSGYHSAVVTIAAPDTRILPLTTNKAYFLIEPDDATFSFKITDQQGGVPIRFKSQGTGSHAFLSQSRYLAFDPSLMDRYVDDANNILYTSIFKTGVLSPFYDEALNTESLDNILLETSNVDKNQRDNVALESATAVELVADDNSVDTGTGVYFHTNSTIDIGLTAGAFYYVKRIANATGNGFKFYDTLADSLADTNAIELDKTGLTFLRTDDFFRIVKYDLVSQETGQIININLVNAGKFYKALPRVHVNVGEGRYGNGAILNPIGDAVGTIKKIEVMDPGYGYTTDMPLVFPLNIHVEDVTKNYIVGEVVSVSADAKGVVRSWDPRTFLLSVNLYTGKSISVGNTVIGATSTASSSVVEATQAVVTANPVALTKFDGYYAGRKSLIDEVNIRVQDSLVYQDFSYVIRSSKPFSEYNNVLKKLAHPAGMFVSGDVNYSIIASNAGINTVRIANTETTSESYSG
jgi:hypothetical protein